MHPTPSRPFLKIWLSLWGFLALAAMGLPANAEYTPESDANLQALQAILELPDEKIDLAKVKLTIDRMIDPKIDIANGLKQLAAMVTEVKARLPRNPTSREKIEVLRTYLYQPGAWNFNQPFRYDLADPFGKNIRNKLLPTYLTTRKGNCISMPLLFIILGQKLGIDVTASTAPEHVFVKYRDEMGSLYNIEAANGGGFARDVWIQQQKPMTAKALANGIYMQPLSKKETVVVMADTLNEFYGQKGQEERRWVLSELELKYYPKYVQAMLHISAANYRMRQKYFKSKPLNSRKHYEVTAQDHEYLMQLERNTWHWRAQAEALGWREPDKATKANYQQIVNRAISEQ